MRALITKTLFVLFVAAVMTGCKIAVIVPSGGQLFASNPAHSCSEGRVCEFDINAGQLPFSESFTAIPKEGYGFEKWSDGSGFLCGKSTNPTCTVNIPDNAVGAILVALFDSGYVMPIFKNVGIDTDSDGVRNELDEDDDNDGIFDADDACPLDSNLNCGINDVSGIIAVDTTWTSEGGPIHITGVVQVADGVTLTIAAGTRVFSDSCPNFPYCTIKEIQIFGSLIVTGTSEDPVLLENVFIIPSGGNGSPSYVEIEQAHITDGTIYWGEGYGSLILRHSVIENSGAGLRYPTSDSYIEYNVFRGTRSLSIGHSNGVSVYIRNNVFTEYTGPVVRNWAAYSGSTIVEFNSFLSAGTATVELESGYSSAAMSATSNYWGTTDLSVIESMVLDKADDLSKAGYIEYAPILTAPHPDTPTGF
jgi:hypothetical protein